MPITKVLKSQVWQNEVHAAGGDLNCTNPGQGVESIRAKCASSGAGAGCARAEQARRPRSRVRRHSASAVMAFATSKIANKRK